MKAPTLILALGAALLLPAAAFAAPMTMAKACAKDVKTVCPGVKPGGGALKDCVKSHFADLSADCQIAIIRRVAVTRVCKADLKQFCADVKPGKGAKAECLRSHASEVSDSCKEAMAKAEAGPI